jgi:hypothetical protein
VSSAGRATSVYTLVPVEAMENRRGVVPSSKLGVGSVRQSDIRKRAILNDGQMCKG